MDWRIFLPSGRSRSEDSVYSPASEDGGSRSEGSSDSKSSLERASHDVQSTQHPHHAHSHHAHHHEAHHMFAPALAALRKKRKKFSASRTSTPAMTSSTNTNPPPESSVVHSVTTLLASRVYSKKQLQRASSVPTRGPELTPQSSITSRRHEVTQSQQPSLDVVEIASISEQQGELSLLHY